MLSFQVDSENTGIITYEDDIPVWFQEWDTNITGPEFPVGICIIEDYNFIWC